MRTELQTIMALAPLLATSVDDSWFPSTIATDTSEWGAGMAAAPLSPATLAAEIPLVVRRGASTSLGRAFPGHRMAQHDMTEPAKAAEWTAHISGPWKRPAHINRLELEALTPGCALAPVPQISFRQPSADLL